MTGIIDWGDALAADPHYELAAPHAKLFQLDLVLLTAFLEGYGWPMRPDFARRALSMALLYEFHALNSRSVRHLLKSHRFETLEQLAEQMWQV